MMDKNKLRKADIFSGSIIFLAGTFIVSQALQMPMKDSWGGVQNVWYVSPAIFPLFVGAMIMLLGGLLVRTAVREVGMQSVSEVAGFIGSRQVIEYAKQGSSIRFFAIVALLLSFVFVFIARVDFFLIAIHFLMVSILMFYVDRTDLLVRFLRFFLAQVLVFLGFILAGLDSLSVSRAIYPNDLLVTLFILSFALFSYQACKQESGLRKKYITAVVVAVTAPILIGSIFKYVLLVPMPFEGMVVEWMDTIRYMQ
ncbi:MAG: hypothetical protein ABIJ31_14100 [Pseudomonadota bacterium]